MNTIDTLTQETLLFSKTAPCFKKLVLIRFLTINLLVFVLQHTGLMMTTIFSSHSPLWFAPGTACAFIFLRGPVVLPGILVGTFVPYYFTHYGFKCALLYANLFVIQTYLLCRLSYYFSIPNLIFYHLRRLLQFMMITVSLTGLVTFVMVALNNHFQWQTWLQWWLADFLGIIIFALSILTWDAYFPQTQLRQVNRWTMGLLYGAVLALSLLCLWSQQIVTLFYSLVPLMLVTTLLSFHSGWWGAVCALFMTGLSLGLGSYLNAPVYFYLPPWYLQVFLLINMIINLSISVNANEKLLSKG